MTRINKASKIQYLNFVLSNEIQEFLSKIPKSSHLSFLRTEFNKKFGFCISEPTQHRIGKKIEANNLVEKDGNFDLIRYYKSAKIN
jgi:hypothetical protein